MVYRVISIRVVVLTLTGCFSIVGSFSYVGGWLGCLPLFSGLVFFGMVSSVACIGGLCVFDFGADLLVMIFAVFNAECFFCIIGLIMSKVVVMVALHHACSCLWDSTLIFMYPIYAILDISMLCSDLGSCANIRGMYILSPLSLFLYILARSIISKPFVFRSSFTSSRSVTTGIPLLLI